MYLGKRRILRYCFLGEILLYGYYYMYGAHGFFATMALKNEISNIQQTTQSIMQNIDELTAYINRWEYEPFFKEQWAREQLQMAHPNDIIYFIQKTPRL